MTSVSSAWITQTGPDQALRVLDLVDATAILTGLVNTARSTEELAIQNVIAAMAADQMNA